MRELNGGLEDYLRELEAAFPLDLSGRRVVLDCANGATYRAAPAIFERLGAEVETIGVEPDGRNINAGCGSTHIERAGRAGRRLRGRDRLRLRRRRRPRPRGRRHRPRPRRRRADRPGGPRDGGARRARRRRRRHRDEQLRLPPGDGGGRDRGRRDPGRRPLRDRRDAAPRLAARRRAVRPHHRLRLRLHRRRHRRGADDDARARRRPARATRCRWRSCRRCWSTSRSPTARRSTDAAAVWEAVERESEALEGRGRVLLRPSGTEPLVRVMVEAPTAEEAEAVCERLAALVRRELRLSGPARPPSTLTRLHVRHRRIRGRPALRGAAALGAGKARIPGL